MRSVCVSVCVRVPPGVRNRAYPDSPLENDEETESDSQTLLPVLPLLLRRRRRRRRRLPLHAWPNLKMQMRAEEATEVERQEQMMPGLF